MSSYGYFEPSPAFSAAGAAESLYWYLGSQPPALSKGRWARTRPKTNTATCAGWQYAAACAASPTVGASGRAEASLGLVGWLQASCTARYQPNGLVREAQPPVAEEACRSVQSHAFARATVHPVRARWQMNTCRVLKGYVLTMYSSVLTRYSIARLQVALRTSPSAAVRVRGCTACIGRVHGWYTIASQYRSSTRCGPSDR